MNKQQSLQKEINMSENLSLNKDNKRKKVLSTFFGAVGLVVSITIALPVEILVLGTDVPTAALPTISLTVPAV